jgi:hypothetical protein
MKKPLFFKHKPNYTNQDPNTALNIMLRKDGRTFDLRYKDTREFVYQGMPTRFYDFMQEVSYRLGNRRPTGSRDWLGGMSWKHYLNPIKQIRYRITGIWYL